MGKSAPKPPDPQKTAAAQTATNVSTAIANSYLGNINQVTPDGSLTYTQTGKNFINDPNGGAYYYNAKTGEYSKTMPTGTSGGIANPAGTGGGMNLPGTGGGANLPMGSGNTVSNRHIDNPSLNWGKNPTVTDPTVKNPSIPNGWEKVTGYYVPSFTATQTLSEAQQKIKDQNDAASFNLSKLANTQSGRLNDLLSSPVDMSGLPAWGDPTKVQNPNYTQFGSGPNLQSQIANAGGIQSQLDDTGDVTQRIAAAGKIKNEFGAAGKIQNKLGSGGRVTGDIANAGDITRSYVDDFSADRQRVEDALMARMNPQLQQDRAALEQRLANQGLQPGSEAYNRAIDEANRSASDSRYGAILSAGQEQSRLAGLARDQATFANAAQQQQYGQNANDAQFANAAQQQRFSQNLAGGQFANDAQQQKFEQGLARTNLSNQAQQQLFGQNLARSQFRNEGQQQKFAQGLAGAQFANQAQNQQYQQNANNAQFSNAALQQMYGNRNTATAANNALQDQTFNSQMAMVNAQNQQRQAQLQEAYAARNQPINEISALLSGSQVSNPQFMNLQGQQIANTDYAGIVNDAYKNQMAGYTANQQAIGGLLGGLAGLFAPSDDRIKKNKTRHGDVKGEMGLWSYNYKDDPAGTPRRVGLMASEVERQVPSAVKQRRGIRYVNYEKALGGK